KRGLVPRFGALSLHRLEERGLLPADVAAGADEDLDVEGAIGPEHTRPHDSLLSRVDKGAFEGLPATLVLVPQIDVALPGAGDQAGDDHPLDHEVGSPLHDESVLDRPGLTLISVTDHVLRLPRGVADESPLVTGREASAAEAAEAARFERRQYGFCVQALGDPTGRVVAGRPAVRVGSEHRRRLAGHRLRPGAEGPGRGGQDPVGYRRRPTAGADHAA